MKKSLDTLMAKKSEYDKESQSFIESLNFVDKEIGQINEMKSTGGWKILNKKIREELQQRINDLIKDDLKVQTLISLLKVADTKSVSKILNENIESILPEE